MDNEKKLENEFKTYEELAKQNKKIDVAALMLNALKSQDRTKVSSRQRYWAYSVSVGLPPLGLLFAFKFYFLSNESDAKRVANICVLLTVLSFLSFWLIGKMIFSNAGVDVNQIQNLHMNDVQSLIN